MRKRFRRSAAAVLAAAMLMSSLTACGKTEPANSGEDQPAPVQTEADAEDTTEEASAEDASSGTAEAVDTSATDVSEDEIEIPEGFHLVWHDEFNGTELNEDDWNREKHQVGWVNHELQEYIPTDEYSFVKEGNLVIQPVKTVDEDGNVSYASGRVNTQNKHDVKYGRFEARIKFPQGKGYLPAFWMMPQDEDLYGQWPKCGEIDIAEVLGDSTNMNYGTVHYGEPHNQNQGTYTLASGDFANEFHVFAVDYEPGVIKWYVDGEQYYETSDWFSKWLGSTEKPYPAPFDQPFHVILNVAVGGDWPGDPDETTPFDEKGAMYVDYVRIYQKESYDENVEKPVKVLEMREADETGNFIHNSDFADAEDLTDDVDWKFLELNGGKGSAEIKDNEIIITTEDCGTEEYSIQLVQPEMPMEEGCKYKYSFEAYAEEDRKMKAAVTAPTANWIRYFPDTSVELTTDWQTFEFEFDMKEESDDKGRVEFNMGNQGSTATIHIRNVRLEKVQ